MLTKDQRIEIDRLREEGWNVSEPLSELVEWALI